MSTKISMIGAGWVVQHCYLPALKTLGIRLECVYDRIPLRAAQLCEAFGSGVPCDSVSDLLARTDDLLVIATPTASHAGLVEAALEAGHLVLCEKPLVGDPEVAASLVRKAAGRLRVSTPYRERVDVRALHNIVESGRIGSLRRVRLEWSRRSGVPRPGSWYTDRTQSRGGVLMDLGPHVLDIYLALHGRMCPTIRQSLGWRSRCKTQRSTWMPADSTDWGPDDVEYQAQGFILLDDASLLEIAARWSQPRSSDRTLIEVEGSEGRAELRTLLGYATAEGMPTPSLRVWDREGFRETRFEVRRDPSEDFGRLLENILGGRTDLTLESQRIVWVESAIDAIYRSSPVPGGRS